MHYNSGKKNILIKVVLCLCSLILSICVAEYVLRIIKIEGLSGYKISIEEPGKAKYYPLLTRALVNACKNFEFTMGECYKPDASERFPLKIINPYDGEYWYCIPYNTKQRRQGYNPERKRQVALVGDSFVFGTGVKEKDTLGYLLNTKYQRINFQNWGTIAADINVVAENCKDIIKFVPAVDEVIYFYNLNDIHIAKIPLNIFHKGNLHIFQLNLNDVPLSKIVSSQEKNIIDFQNIRWDEYNDKGGTIVRFLSKSSLFSLARKIWLIKWESSRAIQNYKDMYFSESNRNEFLSTMDDIRSIKDMLAAREISFRMIIYPLLHKDMLGRYPFEDIHAAIIKACREREITCLDGYVPFKNYYSMKRFTVHPIDYHPNGLSNLVLVDYIYEKNFIKNGQE